MGVGRRANNPAPLNNYDVTETATRKNYMRGTREGQEHQARMTGSGQTREEAANMTTAFLSAKTHLQIGCWNVRTMFDTSRTEQVAREMRLYGLDILGISECRWTGFGTSRTRVGETILYSGRDDNIHRAGVALILKRGVDKSLMEWKPVNERLMMARFKGRHGKLTVIQTYAPTNDAEDEEKDRFYSALAKLTESTPAHDVLIVMGDLNARVGGDNEGFELAMGKHGCGEMNDNGERLASFCATNNLLIGGTIFPHKTIHKITWESPNHRDRNQIDHITINRLWRKSLQDVRVRRGADAGSDHHLVTAKIKIKLSNNGPGKKLLRKFDVKRLRNPSTRQEFNLAVQNRFNILSTDAGESSVEEQWKQVESIYSNSAKDTVGYKKRNDKEWISQDTLLAIDERKKEKAKILTCKSQRLRAIQQQIYQRANTKVKRLARRDKRTFIDGLAKEAEEAARRKEQGTVYKITRKLCGKSGPMNLPVKDKNGTLITSEAEQEKRWNEHFEEVLNRPPPQAMAEIEEAETDLDVNTAPPTIDEIKGAVKALKNGKAPGTDNLNPELFRADTDQTANILQPLFRSIWEEEKIPDDWRKGTIIKVPKKGNLSDCNNWRGITLLSIPSKVLCTIIIRRLGPAIDKILRQEQSGFRRGRGCLDHITVLRNIIEQSTEWQRELYILFVDYEKAFDSLHRESLWRILRSYGVPNKILAIIKQFYHQFTCAVGTSELRFEVKSGVRQGCVMSGLLFIMAIDWITSKATEDARRGIRWTLLDQLDDLDYADDIALLSHIERHIQQKFDRLTQYGEQIGLNVNSKKTKLMVVNVSRQVNVTIKGEPVERVRTFPYLGSLMSEDGGAEEDIRSRLGKARRAFAQLNPVWRSKPYGRETKLNIYNTCVLSVLLYGSECWRMTQRDASRLSSFHTTCLRKICRIFWPQTIRNTDLLDITKQEEIMTIITRRRWRWVGHALRRDPSNLVRTSLTWTPEGRRRRGRPRTTWRRTLKSEARAHNKTWRDLETLAKDRHRWSDLVAALCASTRRNGNE